MAAASSRFGAPSLRRRWETCTPAVLTLMTRVAAISRADLAVGVATGDEGQDLRLPRRQAEELPQALRSVGRPSVRRRELQPRAGRAARAAPARGVAPIRAATAYACLSGPLASAREAPAATSASAWRERQEAARGGRWSCSQAVAASHHHDSGWAAPRARSYSASARAHQPATFRVMAAASAAARRARAMSQPLALRPMVARCPEAATADRGQVERTRCLTCEATVTAQ